MSFRSNVTIPAVAAITFCLIGGTGPAYADLGDQLIKLLAKDGAAADEFGYSVAISGEIAIIGAQQDDDNHSYSGSAYLFDTNSGRQIFKLLPNDGAEGDWFGVSVAISGTTAIVGAVWDDDNGTDSGSAYLFDTTTGRQIAKLLPKDGAEGDWFGSTVALNGTTALVGAFHDGDNGFHSGSAYLFDTATGLQIAKLLPDDGATSDWFGSSVALSGTLGKKVAIVGANLHDDNGNNSGSAYLFDTTTGRQITKLLPNDGAFGDRFGFSVAISGDTVIVGALTDNDNGLDSGSAYLFDAATGRQVAKLLPDDGAADDRFGVSVAISGALGKETAIIGAFKDDDDGTSSGSAYLFDISDPAKPIEIAKLLPNDGAAYDWFGSSVAISGATAIIGARFDDDSGPDSGSAYLFDAAASGMCPWDLDGNGSVGVSDLLWLLGSWGPCPPKGDCPADFDGSGDVGVKDLLFLLGNWGACP